MIESDGKTENAQHVIALDPFTLAVLKAHTETLDSERAEFGPDYSDHGLLFCWENGKPPHPDTITRRFHKLSAAAGLPKINLIGRGLWPSSGGQDLNPCPSMRSLVLSLDHRHVRAVLARHRS